MPLHGPVQTHVLSSTPEQVTDCYFEKDGNFVLRQVKWKAEGEPPVIKMFRFGKEIQRRLAFILREAAGEDTNET